MEATEASVPPALADAVARATGRRPVAWRVRAGTGGFTAARRLFVTFTDGGTAFVKAAVDGRTARWIATEIAVYGALGARPFLPAYLGGSPGDGGDPETAFLALEDLGDCHWPPPWDDAHIAAVLDALAAIRAAAPDAPTNLPHLSDVLSGDPNWSEIVADPAPFLGLGLCTSAWLDVALPVLRSAAASATGDGNDLLHLDVRSDNLCFRPDGSAVLVDWNWACRGDGAFDIAAWLPSLSVQTGRPPEAFAPDVPPGYPAWLAGFWAAQAPKPPPAGAAPRLRAQQRAQLIVSLAWAARRLELPPPNGQSA